MESSGSSLTMTDRLNSYSILEHDQEFIKCYHNLSQEYRDVEALNRRIQKLKSLTESYHIIKYKGATTAIAEVHMELFKWSSLTEEIRLKKQIVKEKGLKTHQRGGEFLEPTLLEFVKQVTKAMLEGEKLCVAHLRLCPNAILLRKQCFEEGEEYFIKVGDYSLGKEFDKPDHIKKLSYYPYMHPYLISTKSDKKMNYFMEYHPECDIWSLGAILFEMIYRRLPFEEGSKKLRTALLEKYLGGEERELGTVDGRYRTVNKLIRMMMPMRNEGSPLKDWGEVKKYLLRESNLTELDFVDDRHGISQVCESHCKVAQLYSCIYCLVLEETKDNVHEFWRVPLEPSERDSRFDTETATEAVSTSQHKAKIALTNPLHLAFGVVVLLKEMQELFSKKYRSHFFTLSPGERQRVQSIEERVDIQLNHLRQGTGSKELLDYFHPSRVAELKSSLKDLCVNLSACISEFSKKTIPSQTKEIVVNRKSRSLKIIHEFCKAMIFLLNTSNGSGKVLLNLAYRSNELENIRKQWFSGEAQ